jgi:predicted ABC-type ATPase
MAGSWYLRARRFIEFDPDQPRWPKGTPIGGRWRKITSTLIAHVIGDPDGVYTYDDVSDDLDGRYAYRPSRAEMHKKWVSEFLVSGTPGQREPMTLFTAGGPGSGKSSLIRNGVVEAPPGAVRVDSDKIKQKIPEFQKLQEAGDPKAAGFVHDESSDVLELLRARGREGRYHMIVDQCGDNKDGLFVRRINDELAAGRRVKIVYADVDVDEAIRRADERAKTPGEDFGRVIPAELIRQKHRGVARSFPEIASMTDVEIELWNTKKNPVLVAAKKPGGPLKVMNRLLFSQFLEKGK